jgi:hypothetical protein
VVDAEPFRLEFFGGKHAVIHESIPVIDNVGVLVNDEFYYPGDSYAVPRGDFVLAVAPRQAFGTHDMTLSRIGKDMGRARLRWAVEQDGGELLLLEPGESADI